MHARTNHRASAFSLVELLIAMGVLAILVSMLFLGGRMITDKGRHSSTRATLAALKGMLAEFDSKTRMSTAPTVWRVWTIAGPIPMDATTVQNAISSSGTLSSLSQYSPFWQIPYFGTSTWQKPDALDAPGQVGGDSPGSEAYTNRHASRQVLNTQLAMQLLLSLPGNKTSLQQFPPERYFVPEFVGGSMTQPSGAAGVQYFGNLGGSETVTYLAGNKVQYQGKKYLCVDPAGVMVASTGSGPGAGFQPDTSPATPLLLDAWNNPIIFVPATGLRVRLLNGKKDNDTGDPKQTFIITSPEGKVDYGGPQPVVVKPGRPFFASAGPDGDFAKGDDNIYSFEP